MENGIWIDINAVDVSEKEDKPKICHDHEELYRNKEMLFLKRIQNTTLRK